jgi:hypothetical protein
MAELPRYRPLGVTIQPLPGVDFAAAGRAKASVYNEVVRGLDVMSKYVYEKQVAETKREALKYAFENPVTPDQIKDALSEGRDVSEIVGDPDTVFGAITTATAAAQLKTSLETQLTGALAKYNAQIESGDPEFDVSKMQTDLTALINGHTNVIAQVDPQKALAYEATANALASTAYKSGLEHSYKVMQGFRKDAANADLNILPNDIKTIFLNHSGDMKQTQGEIEARLRITNDAIIDTGDAAFIEASGAAIRDVVEEQMEGVLVDWATQSDQNTGRALKGDFGDRFTSLYSRLDDVSKAKVREGVRSRRDAKINDEKVVRNVGIENAKKEVQRIQTTMADLPYRGEQYNKQIDQLQALAVLYPEAVTQSSITSLDNALDPTKVDKPNYVGMFELKRRVMSGEIQTPDDLEKQAINLGVGPKDYYSIYPYLVADIKAEEIEINRIISRNAKIVQGTIASETQSTAYFAFDRELSARYQGKITEWQASGSAGTKPTRLSVAKEIDLEYRRSEEQKDINNAVADIERRFTGENPTIVGINIDITETTTLADVEDALRAAGYDDEKLARYLEDARKAFVGLERAKERRDALR